MIATVVTAWVKKENVEDFIAATRDNHVASVEEKGNLRFDIIRSREEPCRFVLYEAYESDEAAAAHKKTAHYLKWKDTVAPWMERPRQGLAHDILFPARGE